MDIPRFIKLADDHEAIDYGPERSVQRANLAADKLWAMMQAAFAAPQEIEILFSLLDHPNAGPWIAYSALEHLGLAEPRKTSCLEIIRALARGRRLRGAGADLWLRDHGYGA